MAAFLITLIAVGLVPVHLRLELRVTPEGCVRAVVAWGALSREFSVGAGALSLKWLAGVVRGMRDPRPLMALPPLVRLNLNVRRVSMRCRVGAPDAAMTAMLSGALRIAFQAMCGWVATWSARTGETDKPEIDVAVVPIFNRSMFEMDAALELNARLGKFANLGARFAIQQAARGIKWRKPTQVKQRTHTA
ncbi:MAG: DUF2953 domain-containing protein [Oscillospiraceae bacterium]|jgi:hypothetical protein|nr:DUF2953 domain-containing protein [Oscillospiraceae bacterium]